MTVSLPWPVQIEPSPDETIVTWLARLAWANRCSVDDLLRDIGVGAKRPQRAKEPPHDQEWQALKEPLKGHVEGFPYRLPDRLSEFYRGFPQFGGIQQLKVCTLCLQAHGIVTYRMQAVYTLACTQHGALLRTVCPHCGQVLRTAFSRVSDTRGCTACGTPYAAMAVLPAPDALLHFQERLNEESQSGELDYVNFQELAFRFGRTQRFTKTFNDTVGRLGALSLHTNPYRRRTALLLTLSDIVGLRANLDSAIREVFAGEFGYLVTDLYGRVEESQALRRRIILRLRQDRHEEAAES